MSSSVALRLIEWFRCAYEDQRCNTPVGGSRWLFERRNGLGVRDPVFTIPVGSRQPGKWLQADRSADSSKASSAVYEANLKSDPVPDELHSKGHLKG